MTSEPKSGPKVEIAHVLNMDVVGYSTLLITEQSQIIAELIDTGIVAGSEADQNIRVGGRRNVAQDLRQVGRADFTGSTAARGERR